MRRQYFKLVSHPTLLKGFVSERVPLNDGEHSEEWSKGGDGDHDRVKEQL